jgi:hypothetical protein
MLAHYTHFGMDEKRAAMEVFHERFSDAEAENEQQ